MIGDHAALICEGSCNPDRIGLEADLVDHRKLWPAIADGQVLLQPSLVGRLRALAYTVHVCVSAPWLWRCTRCDAVRRWGRSW